MCNLDSLEKCPTWVVERIGVSAVRFHGEVVRKFVVRVRYVVVEREAGEVRIMPHFARRSGYPQGKSRVPAQARSAGRNPQGTCSLAICLDGAELQSRERGSG